MSEYATQCATAVFALCAPSAVDNRSKERKKKKKTVASMRWGVRSTPKRIATAACGAAYGAWLPIVKAAAYLTDFMVDRIFRMNPGRWPLPGTRGTCAQVSRIDNRIIRHPQSPSLYLSIKCRKKDFPHHRACYKISIKFAEWGTVRFRRARKHFSAIIRFSLQYDRDC